MARKKQSLNLDTTIPVRVRKSTRKRLDKEAQRLGLHVSALIRMMIEEKSVKEQRKAG